MGDTPVCCKKVSSLLMRMASIHLMRKIRSIIYSAMVFVWLTLTWVLSRRRSASISSKSALKKLTISSILLFSLFIALIAIYPMILGSSCSNHYSPHCLNSVVYPYTFGNCIVPFSCPSFFLCCDVKTQFTFHNNILGFFVDELPTVA